MSPIASYYIRTYTNTTTENTANTTTATQELKISPSVVDEAKNIFTDLKTLLANPVY